MAKLSEDQLRQAYVLLVAREWTIDTCWDGSTEFICTECEATFDTETAEELLAHTASCELRLTLESMRQALGFPAKRHSFLRVIE